MKKYLSVVVVFSFYCSGVLAQSYVGHAVDNYSGVHGILFNPASVVDSNFRTDINLFSASALAGSDYFGLDIQSALESADGFTFDDEVKRFPKDDNQFFLNLDLLGPSFMFNLNTKSSMALTTRVRAFMNLNNINGTLYENLEEDFNTDDNFDFELRNFSGTIHAWGEVGLTYGRILINNDYNFFKGGVTLKYLMGAGTLFVNAPAVTGEYNAETEILTSTGSLNYGMSDDFNEDEIDFTNTASGFGADLGLVYEFRTRHEIDKDPNEPRHSDYRLKLGVSVTDIGSINYSESTVTSYNLDNTVSKSSFEDSDLETVLEEEYEGTEQVVDAKIKLPTALHILADYKFRNRLYLAVHGSLSLIEESAGEASRVLNTVTAVPRFESKWLSFSLPVGVRQYDGFTMGAGFRFGPLSLGSGSVISNFISESTKTTDFYLGLKIPIYRK